MKILSCFMTILLLSACSPDAPTSLEIEAPQSEQTSAPLPPVDSMNESALAAEWMLIAQAPQKFKGDPRVFAIGLRLDTLSPTALSPFIALLGKPDTSAETKIFILESTHYYMDTDYIPHLTPLLNSSDPTTRSCATTLLGGINDEVVIKSLTKMRQESDPRVAFAAWSGLAQQGIDPHRREFIDQYSSPTVRPNQRAEIVRILLKGVKTEDEAIASAVITASDTEPTVRKLLVMALADVGTPTSIPMIESSTSLDASEEYKMLAEASIAMIQKRHSTN